MFNLGKVITSGLTAERLRKENPEWVFFIDWSWKIPKEIYETWKCVVFHASNLPAFRGGSPIQNQISRGITKTKLSAIRVTEGIDEGNILAQMDLSLNHTLDFIWKRITLLASIMMKNITNGCFQERPQAGEASCYARRDASDSRITEDELSRVYDKIRMLDSDDYPRAFIEQGVRYEFSQPRFDGKQITARAVIKNG